MGADEEKKSIIEMPQTTDPPLPAIQSFELGRRGNLFRANELEWKIGGFIGSSSVSIHSRAG